MQAPGPLAVGCVSPGELGTLQPAAATPAHARSLGLSRTAAASQQQCDDVWRLPPRTCSAAHHSTPSVLSNCSPRRTPLMRRQAWCAAAQERSRVQGVTIFPCQLPPSTSPQPGTCCHQPCTPTPPAASACLQPGLLQLLVRLLLLPTGNSTWRTVCVLPTACLLPLLPGKPASLPPASHTPRAAGKCQSSPRPGA